MFSESPRNQDIKECGDQNDDWEQYSAKPMLKVSQEKLNAEIRQRLENGFYLTRESARLTAEILMEFDAL